MVAQLRVELRQLMQMLDRARDDFMRWVALEREGSGPAE
jgi:hypothetical protein